MSYDEQLSAARFKAERDLARQELDRLREELEAMKPRLMPEGYEWSDGFAGAVDFFEAVHDLLYTIDGEEHTGPEMVRDVMARLMPGGMEWLLDVWPKWSNGDYCKFGDWWTADKYGDYEPKQLRRLVFYTPEQLREWEQDEGDNFGYEWDFMRPSDTTYRPDKAESPHRDPVLAADGKPPREGETVYLIDSPTAFVVDDIMTREDGATVVHLKDGAWHLPQYLTHERPESWERIEEDANKNPFDYCKDVGHSLDTCENSEAYKSRDLVRRAKKLAERGE